MVCQVITLPDGVPAIVCGPRGRADQRCGCGKRANLLCDWKVGSGTCDTPICNDCTFSPAINKDLCPAHRHAYADWQARQAARANWDNSHG